MQTAADLVYENAKNGGAAAGSLFWILYHDTYPDYDKFGIYYPQEKSGKTYESYFLWANLLSLP